MSPARPVPQRLRAVSGLPDRVKNVSRGIGTPLPPRHLSRAAKTEWRRVVKACAMYALWLQETDRPMLEAWCTWRAVQLEAIAALADDGALIPGRSTADKARGADVKHAAVAVLRAATVELRALSQRLGFDPDSRSKIALDAIDPDEDDDDDIWEPPSDRDTPARRLLS